MSNIETRGYAHPEVLVSTDWVAAHLNDPNVRIIESNEDTLLYASGHVPGRRQRRLDVGPQRSVRRDYITREGFEALMSRIGATQDTTVVFYGDKNNWWACYAFWVFQLFGHTNAKVMDGGRAQVGEGEAADVTRDVPSYREDDLQGRGTGRRPNPRVPRRGARAHAGEAASSSTSGAPTSTPGARMHMPDYPNEGALRGGHIPGAKSIPWAQRHQPRRRNVQDRRGAEEALRRGEAAVATTSRRSPTAASASAAATPGSC